MDSLLSSTDIEEALSTAYVHSVAAAAGYVVSLKNFDRDGIDITIEAGGGARPKIDIQVKATINLFKSGANFKYPLKKRNYDLLTLATQTPRILVVLHLPEAPDDWVKVEIESLVLKNCAYWVCLTGMPESVNTTSVTIDIPEINHFNKTALIDLMEKSRTGTLR